ncbi:MAG: RNA 2',3'-cyclic phosphodiesterase [Defluviitaleaceae bacterium]|nr:RNA 2',3'-cyclic phosphodiesterase [Defluviitaleaceae bacterium]
MRLFIAINLEKETRDRLTILQDGIRVSSKKGSFTLQDNMHITLAFLGECTPRQTDAAKRAIDEIQFDPFDITIDSIGRFKRETGDIWWAGIKKSQELLNLQHKLTEDLIAEGFDLENRSYTPHITLGRKVITNTTPKKVSPFSEKVHTINLMKSERVDGVLIYTSIYKRGKKLKPIVVAPYNPDWVVQFEKIKAFLLPYIGRVVTDIHHIGSTSVPGLSAKPIIDFDIEIESMKNFPAIKEQLGQLGYKHLGDVGIPGREAFMREIPDDFMAYHMYVCPSDSPELRRHIKLRDYLRANPKAAEEYGLLKTALAKEHVTDIDAYINGKTTFILRTCIQ